MRCQVCSAEYGTLLLKCSCRRETRKMSKRSLGEMCGSTRKLCKQARVSRFSSVLQSFSWCCHIAARAFYSWADLELTALSMWQTRNCHNLWVRCTEFCPLEGPGFQVQNQRKKYWHHEGYGGASVWVFAVLVWPIFDSEGSKAIKKMRIFTTSLSLTLRPDYSHILSQEGKKPTKQEQIVQSISGDV